MASGVYAAPRSAGWAQPAIDFIHLPAGQEMTLEEVRSRDQWQSLEGARPNFGYVTDTRRQKDYRTTTAPI